MLSDGAPVDRRQLLTSGLATAGLYAGSLGGGERRLPERANGLGWHDVRDFGAVGDGVTDDRAAIVRAAAAASAAGGPTTLYFPAGTYLMNDGPPPELGDNVTARGEGASSILKRGPATTYFGLLVNRDYLENTRGARNLAVLDLTFDANGAAQSPPFLEFRHCIALLGVHNALIRGCRFINLSGDGIYLGSTIDGVARENYSRDIRIVDNHFDGNVNGRNGVSIIHGMNITISANTFVGVASDVQPGGVDLEPDKPNEDIINVSIVGNTFENCREGIHTYGGLGGTLRGLTIVGNTIRFSRSTAHGIGLIDIDQVTVTGNTISDTVGGGIRLEECAHATVTDNSITGVGEETQAPGIWATACPSIVISGNAVFNCRGDAYRLEGCRTFALVGNAGKRWDAGNTGDHHGIRGVNGSVGGMVTGNILDGEGRRAGTALVTRSGCTDWNVTNNMFRNIDRKTDMVGRNRDDNN